MTQLGGGAFLGILDGANYYLQSQQFTSVLSNLHVRPEIYLGLAILGFVTFVAHGRA